MVEKKDRDERSGRDQKTQSDITFRFTSPNPISYNASALEGLSLERAHC